LERRLTKACRRRKLLVAPFKIRVRGYNGRDVRSDAKLVNLRYLA
jgi:hypothetical protein